MLSGWVGDPSRVVLHVGFRSMPKVNSIPSTFAYTMNLHAACMDHVIRGACMTSATKARKTTISLRPASWQRALIDQAARLSDKGRTEFILEAACEKAQQVLLDRTIFALDETGFQRFSALLDTPLDNQHTLTKLLRRRAAWESADQ